MGLNIRTMSGPIVNSINKQLFNPEKALLPIYILNENFPKRVPKEPSSDLKAQEFPRINTGRRIDILLDRRDFTSGDPREQVFTQQNSPNSYIPINTLFGLIEITSVHCKLRKSWREWQRKQEQKRRRRRRNPVWPSLDLSLIRLTSWYLSP